MLSFYATFFRVPSGLKSFIPWAFSMW